MNQQTFKNNFNDFENTRFDLGIALLMTLFSTRNWDNIEKKIKEQLLDVNVRQDDNKRGIKGEVYANKEDDIDKLRMYYVEHNSKDPMYSWQIMLHELSHFLGSPSIEGIENEINSGDEKSNSGGVQIFDFNTNNKYGKAFNECGVDIISNMALSMYSEARQTHPEIRQADDIIHSNKTYLKTEYNPMSTITRLLIAAMDNNFTNETYDAMMHSDDGLIDRTISRINNENGQVLEEVPVNDFLYGLTGNGKHVEQQFDKYSNFGTYENMCKDLDSEFQKMVSDKNYRLDTNLLKEQMLKMADMINNKLYILQYNKCITVEQKNKLIGNFNTVFNQAMQEYGIPPLNQEDLNKTTKSMNATYYRLLEQQEVLKQR